MLTEITIKRLAFIKYLYKIAVDQSLRPEPLCCTSILTFHDSIELFLQLSSEHLNAESRKNLGFMDYWDVLSSKLPEGGLTQKESMRRLNKSRVALKHHGIMPSRLDIEAFRASATNFFQENTPRVFGIEFDALSLINLVQCEKARGNLEEASKLLKEGNKEDALNKIALAFSQIIDDYEDRKQTMFGRSPFFFGRPLTFESSFFMKIKDEKLATFIDKVKESIEAMQDAIKIISLGIDYRRYVKFRLLTPYIIKTLGGTQHIVRTLNKTEKPPSMEDCRFCFDFVIESAINLQEFDFDIERYR